VDAWCDKLATIVGRQFIMLSVHLCVQHDVREAARRAGLSVAVETCYSPATLLFVLQYTNLHNIMLLYFIKSSNAILSIFNILLDSMKYPVDSKMSI